MPSLTFVSPWRCYPECRVPNEKAIKHTGSSGCYVDEMDATSEKSVRLREDEEVGGGGRGRTDHLLISPNNNTLATGVCELPCFYSFGEH